MEARKFVIRRPLLGNVILIFTCVLFTIMGFYLLQDQALMLVGIVSIIFFGAGGFLYIILMAWRPIAVISSSGITVSYGWGENFVAWENVRKFEVVEQTYRVKGGTQTNKYIGIFANNPEGIVGAGKFSKTVSQMVTKWDEVPDLLIVTYFSFLKIEKVMEIIQEFYDEYRNTQLI